ncbi:MAG: protein kinase [Nocardioides sp.]
MPQFPRVGDVFGRYRIDAQIGQGGMGVVFSATDTAFDRRVALKVVSAALGGSAEFLARFEREAALLARLNSPHVIAIFDYGEQDGCPYLATQYVGGGDLGALMAARGPMPPKLAVEVCAQVADALADAHRAGVVHRDVKPTNVLLRDADTLDLHAYLCDFGIARTDGEGLTAPGSVSGTWSYLAPECGTGAPGTVSSDLYALGCLLWAALTGQAPFRGTDVEIAIAHQRAPVPQLAGDDPFTRHVNAILANTLAKDPRARYADADAVRADLLAAAAVPSTGVRPPQAAAPARPAVAPPTTGQPNAMPRTAPPRRRRRALVVSLTCLAVLAVAGGIVAATVAGDDPSSSAAPGGDPTTPSASGGTSGSPTPEPPEPPEVVGPVTGDVDGDGFGDLAVREYIEPKGKHQLLTWSSSGTAFGDPATRPDRTDGDKDSRQRVLADLDGDDLLDTVVLDTPHITGDVRLVAELSTGASLDKRLPRPTGGRYVTTFGGDADGDGLDDLVVLAWDKRVMRVWVARSTGSGLERLRPALDLDTGYQESQVEVGDFDGDGRVDIAVLTTPEDQSQTGTSYTSTLDLYLAQAGGRFVSDEHPRSFPTTIGNFFLSGDFDGDEDSELALVESRTGFMQLNVLDYDPSGGDSGITRPKAWGLVQERRGSFFDSTVVTGDYDGDGLDDLLCIGPSATPKVAEIRVAASTGSRFANATPWATWRYDLVDSYGTHVVGETFP